MKPTWQNIETDGLPEYMRATLIWCPESKNVFCAYYYFYAGSQDASGIPIWAFFDSGGPIQPVEQKVTHWMLMPEGPTL